MSRKTRSSSGWVRWALRLIGLKTLTNAFLDHGKMSLREFLRAGGGFVGIHNAFGTEYNWPYYEGLLGNANYYIHGPAQDGLVKLISPDYITSGLPGAFTLHGDEWYNLMPFPTNVKFLATVDEKSLRGGS